MRNFKTFQLSKELYKKCKKAPVKGNVRDQLIRASLSICLNLAEGNAKQSDKERRRFFYISLGSQREVHCLLELEDITELIPLSDQLGGCLFNLIRSIG